MAYTPSCMHMALLQALSILLLASMLVPGPGSAEEAPSGYRIELIHVDANGGFTREELINRTVDRAHLREAMLSATDGTNSPASSGTYSVAAVLRDRKYLMELKIGTPAKPLLAIADTGSDLVWTKQLKLCNRSASSTFTHVNCSDSCPDGCKSSPAGGMCGTCCDGLCMFKKTYGRDNKTARGFMGNETLTLSDKTTDGFAFGCAIDNDDNLFPGSADGIVGLDRGPKSLVQQLNVTKLFSYCLSTQSSGSRFWFGDGADLGLSAGGESSSSYNITPLVQISKVHRSAWANDKRYYVELVGIAIAQNKKYERWLPENHFKLKSTKDKAVMFVDVGTQHTYLERTVFEVLKELLTVELGITSFTGEKSGDESTPKKTCFQPTTANHGKPDMVLYFPGAEMHLPWASYTYESKKEAGLFCLAIYESEEDSFLGNLQQQNIHMLYNLTKRDDEKLSFARVDDCSTLGT